MNKRQRNEAAPGADLDACIRTYFPEQLLLRSNLKKLSKLILDRRDRIPINELADLSSTIVPAVSGTCICSDQIYYSNSFVVPSHLILESFDMLP